MPATTRRLLALLLVPVVLLTGCTPGGGEGSRRAGDAGTDRGPAATADGPRRYVAIGDSYTSAPFVPQTDVAGGCFRSTGNYPSQVAEALGAELTDVSCAGAETTDVRSPQLDGVAPQADALQPGVELVTVSLGGNDGAVFSSLVGQCGRPGGGGRDCAGPLGPGVEDRLRERLRRTGVDLTRVLRLAVRRAPDARVLAVGYPTIVDGGSGCEALPLTAPSLAVAARLNTTLNDTVRRAARRAGVEYVDVATVTAEHAICAEDPWINGAVTDQRRALAFHPFAAEQQAVAELVVAAATS